MRFAWLLCAVFLGVLGLCLALPDKDEPTQPGKTHRLMLPLRERHQRDASRWRLSRLIEDKVAGGSADSDSKREYDRVRSGSLFRRQADTDALMDKLLHIRRHHAPV